MDENIETLKHDTVYVKDDFKEDLITNALQTNRIKSFNKLLIPYKEKA